MTAEGLASLRAELARLEGEGRRDIAERIGIAREWGDLKENAEYHDAKNSQAMLETRIAVINDRVLTAVVVEPDTTSDVVTFGSTVTIRDEGNGKETTYTLVSSREADPTQGRLSMESPLASALRGSVAGETVTLATPRGSRELTVVRVGA